MRFPLRNKDSVKYNSYASLLKRDIIVAVLIKAILIGGLIFSMKYYKNEMQQMNTERYPLFSSSSENSISSKE